MNPKVDEYLGKIRNWQVESEKLRKIVLDCGLTEELKWGKPCYTYKNSNIVIIQGFKTYCALLFFKGVLLKDPNGILVKTGENTHVGRQARFTSAQEIIKKESILKSYIHEAVEAEKAGLKVPEKEKEELEYSEEFTKKLEEMPALKTAFKSLTPGRQRAYIFYFNQAKQAKTRESRIEKCMSKILAGKGLNDR